MVSVHLMFPSNMTVDTVSKHVLYLRRQGCQVEFERRAQDIGTIQSEDKLRVVQDKLKQSQLRLKRLSEHPRGGGRPRKQLPFASRPTITVDDKLTANEVKILNVALKRSHAEITHTPLLDCLEQQGLTSKPSMTQVILEYYRQYPGHTVRQCAEAMSPKFAVHYDGSATEACRCFKNLINLMCKSKGNQKALRKVGGSPGISHGGKVYLCQ